MHVPPYHPDTHISAWCRAGFSTIQTRIGGVHRKKNRALLERRSQATRGEEEIPTPPTRTTPSRKSKLSPTSSVHPPYSAPPRAHTHPAAAAAPPPLAKAGTDSVTYSHQSRIHFHPSPAARRPRITPRAGPSAVGRLGRRRRLVAAPAAASAGRCGHHG
jgi:hypothetical protein